MTTNRSPSIIPSAPAFPFILPQQPQPHPTPLPGSGKVKLSSRRNLEQEANDLSDEEAEVDDALLFIRNRGANYLIPLGRRHTLMEERADAQGDSDSSGASGSDAGGSDHNDDSAEEEEEEEAADLDADMEDLDRETDDEDDAEEDDGDEEEGDDVDEDEDGEDADGEDEAELYGGQQRNYW
ncbi:hypothetical protein FRC03_008144 [Tulasnella sp. 419]|nr:hypothetical protein FRC02_005740 [Tulasnella sp. 418]KAG8968278.1 hypothetical protein FRC03_008144 [Tulasnella sp. 419]